MNNAYLVRATLSFADLICVNLENANLKEANLVNANLEYARFNNANLENVRLNLANLRDANLETAKNLSLFYDYGVIKSEKIRSKWKMVTPRREASPTVGFIKKLLAFSS